MLFGCSANLCIFNLLHTVTALCWRDQPAAAMIRISTPSIWETAGRSTAHRRFPTIMRQAVMTSEPFPWQSVSRRPPSLTGALGSSACSTRTMRRARMPSAQITRFVSVSLPWSNCRGRTQIPLFLLGAEPRELQYAVLNVIIKRVPAQPQQVGTGDF